MSSILKVDTIQDQSGNNIINESGNVITIGASGDTITVPAGATLSGDLNASNLTSGTVPDARITGAYTGITNLTMSGDLTVDTNTLFVDASANTVGIGTSSPSRTLSVFNTTPIVALQNSTTGQASNDGFQLQLSSDDGYVWNYESSGHTIFGTANTERMRIDSSGNLLVGKTNQTANVSGTEIEGSGTIVSTRASNTNLFLNRTGNDGQLINFRKDNSVVGSIGTASGKLNLGTENCQIIFRDDLTGIIPANSDGSNSNNDLNLGHSNVRWKDLYLGNSIDLSKSTNQAQVNIRSTVTPNGSKLGGEINLSLGSGSNSGSGNTSTQVGDILGNINFNGQGTDYSFQGGGIEVQQTTPIGQTNRTDAGCDMIFKVISAGGTGYTEKLRIKSSGGITFNGDTSVNNALDDYEEGNWTPGVTFGGGNTGVSSGASAGSYTKVGRIVYVSALLLLGSKGSSTGNAILTGLPFTAGNGNKMNGAVSFAYIERISFNEVLTGSVTSGGTTVSLYEAVSGNVSPNAITNSDFNNSTGLRFNITYQTD
jgi:hypothetical protein